jgi:flagellar hook-associated protein 3 FlgL
MDRVSTSGNYSAILANLMAAQQRQVDAGNEVATQKNGSSLKDYARNAEMLTSMTSINTRLTGYSDQNTMIADKLTTQNTALSQVADATDQTRQSIADALASGRVDTLMQDLQGQFTNAVSGLNIQYDGKYLFAGGQTDTQPVSAAALSDLTQAGATIPGFFHNDTFVTQAKVNDSTTIQTGMLADKLGTNLMTAYQGLEQFNQGVDGPFTGLLTDNQRAFLETQLANWDQIHQDLTTATAVNGMAQSRLDNVNKDVADQQQTLQTMMGGITDADMAKAASNLTQAQLAVQAVAQVFNSLKSTSLLNVLSAG